MFQCSSARLGSVIIPARTDLPCTLLSRLFSTRDLFACLLLVSQLVDDAAFTERFELSLNGIVS